MGRLALTVSYDGAAFAGSQAQAGRRTVQGTIEEACSRLFACEARVELAGRTDTGVHAAGQVVGCDDGRPEMDEGRLRRGLDALLPNDVAVVRVERKPNAFHARYDARWREYRYRIWTGGKAPLAGGTVWERRSSLDLDRMLEAAQALVGMHDFASFTGVGSGVPWADHRGRRRGTVRTVYACDCRTLAPWWTSAASPDEAVIEIVVVADGFLPRMVRTIAGALVEVGQGTRPASWIGDVLAARDRRAASGTAPARGLTLWRVGYDGDRYDDWRRA